MVRPLPWYLKLIIRYTSRNAISFVKSLTNGTFRPSPDERRRRGPRSGFGSLAFRNGVIKCAKTQLEMGLRQKRRIKSVAPAPRHADTAVKDECLRFEDVML